jgi:hypothetical protein
MAHSAPNLRNGEAIKNQRSLFVTKVLIYAVRLLGAALKTSPRGKFEGFKEEMDTTIVSVIWVVVRGTVG